MHPTVISFDDESEAEETAEALRSVGHYVETGRERFLGENDDEAVVFLVLTDARPSQARGHVVGEGFVVS